MKKRMKYYTPKRNMNEIIDKRYNILNILIIIIFSIIMISIFNITILKNEEYQLKVNNYGTVIIESPSAPRGRIYDRNGNLIVDNMAIKTIYYLNPGGLSNNEEVKLAYKVANLIELDIEKLHLINLKEFWIANNYELSKGKITEEELKAYKERKLDNKDIYNLKIERITETDLSIYSDKDKEAAYIYYLMNQGYYFDEKIIKDNNVTDKEYALIAANIEELKGFNRTYIYNDVFKGVLGNVSNIPQELKDYYLEKGYKLDDIVGVSNIELEYGELLKGKKIKYELTEEGAYTVIEEGKRGNDIYLTIDIKLQKKLEEILEQEVLRSKKEKNTDYYNKSFVVIAEPKTGEILAMAGKQVIDDKIYDYTPGVINSAVTAGSVVKGASMIVGYANKAIEIGDVKDDMCIKIKNTPQKCSWKYLGKVDDIRALAMSSNSYQYQIAIDVGGGVYEYNKPLNIDKGAFDIYRNMYANFGLGVSTGIDLPNESLGYKGSSTLAGHLLDFAIGQYDNYTPLQLSSYINTIANDGVRMKAHLLKAVYKEDRLIYKVKPEVLSEVLIDLKYIKRVQEGFKAVISWGTGYGYMKTSIKPAGKTGTSQSFVDSDNDGKIDVATYTKSFVGYAPYDDPKMSIIVTSPDISYPNNATKYISPINARLASQISAYFFQNQ